MIVEWTDFNGAEALMKSAFSQEWKETRSVLERLPLHLKPSDQAGKQGQPIFDPVATNIHLKHELANLGWSPNLQIPVELQFLGKDVDFFKRGLLLEAQFSNYPFLLNNVIRSALLIKARADLQGKQARAITIIAKSHMIPSSNSVLYYEQGVRQLSAFFGRFSMLEVPVRLVGLFERTDAPVNAVWNSYPGRYSRAAQSSQPTKCTLTSAGRQDSICRVKVG